MYLPLKPLSPNPYPYPPSIEIIRIQTRPNRQLIRSTGNLPCPIKDAQRTLRIIPHNRRNRVRIPQRPIARQDIFIALERIADIHKSVGDAIRRRVAGIAAFDQTGDVGGLDAKAICVAGTEVGIAGVEGGALVVVACADNRPGTFDGGGHCDCGCGYGCTDGRCDGLGIFRWLASFK